MKTPPFKKPFAAAQGLFVVFAALFPAIGATFQLGAGLSQVEKMKESQASASEEDALRPKISVELAGKYEVDPVTLDPGMRLRRVRTMQVGPSYR